MRAAEQYVSHANHIYHIVFGTKGRLLLINVDIKPRLHQYIGATVRGRGGIPLEINGIEDHVHLLVKLKPTIHFPDFVRDLKSNTSAWAKKNGMRMFSWQRRHGSFTASESQIETVRRYIRNQEQHHKKFSFKTEYESLLRANHIEIDDFVWQE